MQKTFNQIFILRKTNPKLSQATVYLRITIAGARTEFSIQRQCIPEKWNSAKGRLDGKTAEVKSFNKYLDSVEHKIFEIFQSFITSTIEFDGEKIKARYLGQDIVPPKMLMYAVDVHNEEFKSLVGNGYAYRTYQKYLTVKKYLSEFLKHRYKTTDMKLDDVTYDFLRKFEIYLKVEKKSCHNTAMHYLKKVKRILNQCVAKDWIERNPFTGFRMTTEETHPVFLSEAELNRIENRELDIPRLNLVRDIFIFSCYTGLAYCDVISLTKDSLVEGDNNEKWINTFRAKTGTSVRVPLLPTSNEILKKYVNHPIVKRTGKILPVLSNQKMNSYLKELSDMCNIKKDLTFHCARHTFATTVTLTNGVPLETVSKMLGHRSVKTTQHYARIIDKKVSQDMSALRSKLELRASSLEPN